MSYRLEQPYTEQQRFDFIVEHNHNQGLRIEENETVLYALQAWELLDGDTVIDNRAEWEEEQAQKERERLDMLFLTAADVERAIYKAKGMDFEDIITFISQNPPMELDVKALKIELKANNFFRGNPYVQAIGDLLGFTSQQLDEFFETNDYTKLLPATEVNSDD